MSSVDQASLEAVLQASPYASYAYSYPHKTAYRALEPPIPLRDTWAEERRDTLFLYLHVPFCEMRCGFCNLFTTVNRDLSLHDSYLDALEVQARRIHAALGPASFARMAVGGGTPTLLAPEGLHRLFDIAETYFGVSPRQVLVSVETSPLTCDAPRLSALRQRGVGRISIGVQSFVEAEVHAVGRSQQTATVEAALERIRAAGFATLNLDLMYGLPGQTVKSWLSSLRAALRFSPEEIYLYPLYIRPLTGLDRRSGTLGPRHGGDIRLACYRAGREMLLGAGYRQVSMRMFQASRVSGSAGPVYCCQEDGMVGVGCGARSYTSELHYSSEFAVGATGVRAILADYLARPVTSFDCADYGFALDAEEQRRRYLIQSLLQSEGLSLTAYRRRFGTEALEDVPELAGLELHGLAAGDGERLCLNEAGIERSDAIGPWLGSARVRQVMQGFALR